MKKSFCSFDKEDRRYKIVASDPDKHFASKKFSAGSFISNQPHDLSTNNKAPQPKRVFGKDLSNFQSSRAHVNDAIPKKVSLRIIFDQILQSKERMSFIQGSGPGLN